MNFFESFKELATNHDEELLAARNAAQYELAEKKGVDFGLWMDMKYDDQFRNLVEQDPEILERLIDDKTHGEEIEKLATKLYH